MLSDNIKDQPAYKWCVAVGITTLANSLFNCFVICNHPEYQKINAPEESNAGSDPSKMTDEQVKAYLKAHPEVAAAALGSAKAAGRGADAPSEEKNDWVAQATSTRAAAPPAGGLFSFGSTKHAASKAADTYVPPVVPFSNSAAAPAPTSAAPPTVPGAFAIDDENPFKT
jgi:hypothetical protein